MVGLSAAELQSETLFPGDTIEYFSMAFVAGDKRGHRVSKVLRIDRRDEDFPIRVDTQEMLPLTILIKRNRDRNEFDISSDDAKWRKLRTFKLVDGEVKGETRADRLNADMKEVFANAMKATKKKLEQEKAEKANAGSKKIMTSFFVKPAGSDDDEDLEWHTQAFKKKISTPEKSPKKRKPLAPREKRDSPRRVRVRDKDEFTRHRDSGKTLRLDRRPQSESTKHHSQKRKRLDLTPQKTKRSDPVPRKAQKSISKFFSAKEEHPRSKKRTDLVKFVNHLEERKQDPNTDINEYLELDAKQQEVLDKNEGSKAAQKAKWAQQRQKYRSKTKPLELWLSRGSQKQENELESASAGSPSNNRVPASRPGKSGMSRTLNLAPEKAASPKVHRRDLSFICGDAEHRTKGTKHKKRGDSKQEASSHKKRGSLGSLSAKSSSKGGANQKTPSSMSQWIHRR